MLNENESIVCTIYKIYKFHVNKCTKKAIVFFVSLGSFKNIQAVFRQKIVGLSTEETLCHFSNIEISFWITLVSSLTKCLLWNVSYIKAKHIR